jgi:hypothetical protein
LVDRLAAVPFLAVLIGLWVAYGVVAETQGLAASHAAAPQIYTLAALDMAVGLIFLAFLFWRRRILTGRMSARVARMLPIAYVLTVSVLFVASVLSPFFPADIAPRAAIMPLLFGSFVFIATWLAWASHKICVPVLALSIVAALGVTAFNPHFNDVRTLDSASDDLSKRQLNFDDAVKRWMDVNCDKTTCPPALVVALEGGASRAAFAAATAIGELLDEAGKLPDSGGRPIAPARRIFAISGVSGGSVGAATIRTALSDSLQRGQGGPPCLEPTSNWFRKSEEGDPVRSKWRASLQALVSGDYLTPAFVGLAFRDNLSPPNPVSSGSMLFSDDRAALIERAIERNYDYAVRRRVPTMWEEISDDLLGPGSMAQDSGMRRRFGFVWDINAPDGGWLPLLLLNGTSAGTGARVIASDIISTRSAHPSSGHDPGRFPLYPAPSMSSRCFRNPVRRVRSWVILARQRTRAPPIGLNLATARTSASRPPQCSRRGFRSSRRPRSFAPKAPMGWGIVWSTAAISRMQV